MEHTSTGAIDVFTLYSAACDVRSFTGPVGPELLRATLARAGLDPIWLDGERWDVLSALWRRGAPVADARAELAGFQT